MVLIAAACCPHPPLLIPEAGGATAPAEDRRPASEQATDVRPGLADVRTACELAVAELSAARPDVIIVVGTAGQAATYPGDAAGGLRQYGIGVTVGAGPAVLPLSLTVGGWLLDRSGWPRAATAFRAVRADDRPAECLATGRALASEAPRVGLLAMGDGSARRSIGVPGASDPEADRFDADVEEALGSADAGRLAGLDPATAARVLAGGRAVWQVLAGAAAGRLLHGRLLSAAAPLGVRYAVASWAG